MVQNHSTMFPGFQNIGRNRNISNRTHFKTLPWCRPFLEPRKISLNRKINEIFPKTVSWTLSGNLPFLAPILNLWSKTTQPCSQVSKTLVGTEFFPTELISRHYHDVDHYPSVKNGRGGGWHTLLLISFALSCWYHLHSDFIVLFGETYRIRITSVNCCHWT